MVNTVCSTCRHSSSTGDRLDSLDFIQDSSAKGWRTSPINRRNSARWAIALALGLQALYEAMAAGRPIVDADADRARLLRLAETYRTLDGPSAALVNAWVAAASTPK